MHPLGRIELLYRKTVVWVVVISHPDAPVTAFEAHVSRHWNDSPPGAWRLEFGSRSDPRRSRTRCISALTFREIAPSDGSLTLSCNREHCDS